MYQKSTSLFNSLFFCKKKTELSHVCNYSNLREIMTFYQL